MRIEWLKFDDYVPARITKKSLGFVPFFVEVAHLKHHKPFFNKDDLLYCGLSGTPLNQLDSVVGGKCHPYKKQIQEYLPGLNKLVGDGGEGSGICFVFLELITATSIGYNHRNNIRLWLFKVDPRPWRSYIDQAASWLQKVASYGTLNDLELADTTVAAYALKMTVPAFKSKNVKLNPAGEKNTFKKVPGCVEGEGCNNSSNELFGSLQHVIPNTVTLRSAAGTTGKYTSIDYSNLFNLPEEKLRSLFPHLFREEPEDHVMCNPDPNDGNFIIQNNYNPETDQGGYIPKLVLYGIDKSVSLNTVLDSKLWSASPLSNKHLTKKDGFNYPAERFLESKDVSRKNDYYTNTIYAAIYNHIKEYGSSSTASKSNFIKLLEKDDYKFFKYLKQIQMKAIDNIVENINEEDFRRNVVDPIFSEEKGGGVLFKLGEVWKRDDDFSLKIKNWLVNNWKNLKQHYEEKWWEMGGYLRVGGIQ